ncbi:TetR/AcrR family transcriptional regulator [Actinophytocola sp.]|uniref:TetR/AcrR family transcriptional regulator n=1 Tax=Actinophytocola sp. TaxID=1872138 RepID=UPI002D7E9477|nr:TetR/AcrR family transcriptional regulator [Actinophytocola sp.]HET9143708.1 TetR/AcrR family transcriptional regulator [Actinophytocola sp.]
MSAAPDTGAIRQPQQDRSRATRRRLLEAAIECLAEHGWSGSTVSVVAERAGVSRGAAQHHFPTREDLVTAAVEFVSEERTARLREHLAELPTGPGRVQAVIDLIDRMYTGPLFRAALQLWLAATSDEQLRARVLPLEAHVGRETHRVALELLGVDESVPGVREVVQGTLDMARGLGLANLLTDDSKRRKRILQQWARILDATLSGAG